jgi:hypothetical protein
MRRLMPIPIAVVLSMVAASCSSRASPSEEVVGIQPTANPEKASIAGVLMLQSENGSEPVPNAILYLAETIEDESGVEAFAALDRVNSPKAITDENGEFDFFDVSPGQYGLVLDRIVNSYLLLHPGEQEVILIVAERGKAVDLGTLIYDELPLSQP